MKVVCEFDDPPLSTLSAARRWPLRGLDSRFLETEGLEVYQAEIETALGRLCCLRSTFGLHLLSFETEPGVYPGIDALQRTLCRARWQADPDAALWLSGAQVLSDSQPALAPLGTEYQLEVWAALLALNAGETLSYQQLAERIGRPGHARAIGQAVGKNPLAVLIPCHRILPASGGLGGYRWGAERKRRLLTAEGWSG